MPQRAANSSYFSSRAGAPRSSPDRSGGYRSPAARAKARCRPTRWWRGWSTRGCSGFGLGGEARRRARRAAAGPGGSPWIVSSSPSSDSSKVSRWRPGMDALVREPARTRRSSERISIRVTPCRENPAKRVVHPDYSITSTSAGPSRASRLTATLESVPARTAGRGGSGRHAAGAPPASRGTRGRPRLAQAHGLGRGVDLEAETGLDQRERRARRPSLRRARHRVERRRLAAAPVEAAEELGQAAQVHVQPRRRTARWSARAPRRCGRSARGRAR